MVIVKDIFKLDISQNFRLLTGEDGLTNPVSWIYVCRENDIRPWVQGHEILILYGSGIDCDEKSLIQMVEDCVQCEIAALVVLTGNYIEKIPDRMIETARQHAIPLIEVSYTIPISQITKEVANLIILQSRLMKSNSEEVLRGILSGYEACTGEEKQKLMQGGYLWKERNVIFALRTPYVETASQIKGILANLIAAVIGTETFFVQKSCVIGLIGDGGADPARELSKRIEILVRELKNKYGLTCHVGIGGFFSEIAGLTESYGMAMQALRAQEYLLSEENIVFFDRLPGLLRILYDSSRSKVPESLSEELLGPLVRHDAAKGTNLIETLRIYLASNCNAKLASEKMFVHRNTLNYRLKLIESLSGRDLSLTTDCFEFLTALYCQQQILAPMY